MFRDGEGPIRVLHVDDDAPFLDLSATWLERADERLTVHTETEPRRALDVLAADPVDCVVSDYQMPGMDGLAFLEAVRESHPSLPFVLFTGRGSEEVAADVFAAGATDYIRKSTGTEQYTLLATRVRTAAERYRFERAAERASRRTEKLVSAAADVISVTDVAGQFQYLSPAIERLLGRDPAALVGESPFDYVHPEDVEAAQAEFARLIDDPTHTARVDTRLRHRDGSWIPVENQGRNLLDDPDVEGVVIYSRNVAARRERERELERYEAIVRGMSDGAWVTDADGRVTFVNERAAAAVETDPAALRGHHHVDLLVAEGWVTEADAARYRERSAALLSGVETGARVRVPLSGPHGDLSLDCRLSALRRDGEVVGLVGVARDVTDLDAREAELAAQRDRLGAFAGAVSHDLQTPLSVARGNLSLVREECDGERLAAVARAHERMYDIIHELLTLARAGQVIDATATVDLERVARRSWDTVDSQGVRLVVDGTRSLVADESRLRNVFENLYRNAAVHAPVHDGAPGSGDTHTGTGADGGGGGGATRDGAPAGDPPVTVRVGPLPDGFYVADDGVGIDPEDRDRVFEVGYTTRSDSTGYGLDIVRQIVEVHGWEIAVVRSASGGARFEVTGVEPGDSPASATDDGSDSRA